jgi:hypothetical protein
MSKPTILIGDDVIEATECIFSKVRTIQRHGSLVTSQGILNFHQ